MNKVIIVLGALLLLSLLFVSAPLTHAALDATCSADPSSIGPYETTTINCSGFSPNTHVWIYYVEPDGTDVAYCFDQKMIIIGTQGNPPNGLSVPCADRKTDKNGDISFSFTNGIEPFFTRELGTWTFVVEELGLGGTKVHQGAAVLQITGEGENVSGATVTASPTLLDRTLDVLTVTGTGYAPGESVDVWLQMPPNCSSFSIPIVISENGRNAVNEPVLAPQIGAGAHTVILGSFQVDASGSFTVQLDFRFEEGSLLCAGAYRIVARALGSGNGGYADFTVTGGNVTENASLVASKSEVNSMNDMVTFAASGFGASETLSCWLTSPEGQAIPMFTEGNPIRVDASGAGVITLYTGAFRIAAPSFGMEFLDPVMSQGALGVWAMSCRGNVSGNVGVASFLMVGGTLDP